MVVIVLSQFWTFTVVRVISVTSPSAPYCRTSIQSPGAIIRFAMSWMPATNPSKTSLKIKRRIAVSAPNPLRKYKGDLSSKRERTSIPEMKNNPIFRTWMKGLIEIFLANWKERYIPWSAFKVALMIRAILMIKRMETRTSATCLNGESSRVSGRKM